MSAARPTAPASHAREPMTFSGTSWRSTVTPTYFAISLLLFLRLAFGCWGLHKIVRGSAPTTSLGPSVFESTRVVVPGSVGGLGREFWCHKPGEIGTPRDLEPFSLTREPHPAI
jgi:hypothetical protein